MTLSRNARHLALPQVGGTEEQQRIAGGKVLLIGVSKRPDCPVCSA